MQTALQTRAEASGYAETSTFLDVTAFCDALARQYPYVKRTTLCRSTEGRDVPLLIVSKPGFMTGAQAHASGDHLVIYIQANIHAGEVEGKEAILMLIRDLLKADPTRILDAATLVIAPIYNADGNEKFGDGMLNRPHQDGPARVGERHNGMGLDLNRDCIKAESPEMRGVLKEVYSAWDPDVVFDLHTTNGTRHGFHLTYGPATHPDTDPAVLRYQRDVLLPSVRKQLRKTHKWELFDYGNAERRGGETIWATFGYEGRYVTNYAGLRNRIGILSEAVSFLPFRFRVETTYQFVLATLNRLTEDRRQIRKSIVAADAYRGPEAGIAFEMAARGKEKVDLEDVPPGTRIDHTKAPTKWKTVVLPTYDRWATTSTAKVPSMYAVPKASAAAIKLLRFHGIELAELQKNPTGFEQFLIKNTKVSPVFQGHPLRTVDGTWEQRGATTEDYWIVSTDQPLRMLIFHLLDPLSTDGFVTWNVFDREITSSKTYPVLRKL
jgi:hypothetical protein